MAEAVGSHAELFHGLPALRLRLPQGDSALVLLYGAQVVSWISGGRERLYLSPRSRFDGRGPVRGGVPICFPQFNQRGPLPKHGFARKLAWRREEPSDQHSPPGSLTLRLDADEVTMALWPHAFAALFKLVLSHGQLHMTLQVRNVGEQSLQFSGALHSYLAVRDITAVELLGLEGQPEWDALTDQHARARQPLRFQGEFDRVYAAGPQPLVLRDGTERLEIAQSASWAHTVVWNPGADQCGAMADMPRDGYASMLCVEAAQVMHAIDVAPGAVWEGWQRLSVS